MAKKANIKFGVFYKIFYAMLLGALLPIGVLSYIDYDSVKSRVFAEVEQSLENNLDQTSSLVDSWTDKTMRALKLTSELDSIRSMDPALQAPVLRTIASNYEWTYLVFTVNAEGDNVARSDNASLKKYGDRDWFKQPMSGSDRGQQVLISRTHGKPAFTLSVPIRNNRNRPIGVLAMANFLTSITDAVVQNKLGETGFAFLVDSQDRLIAHGGGDNLSTELKDYTAHPALLGNSAGNFSYLTEEGEWMASKKNVGLGWTLVVQQKKKEALQPLSEIQKRTALIITATIVIVFLFSLWLSRKLSNPIRQLTQVAEEFSRGNLGITIPCTERTDEIGALARTLQRMGQGMKVAINRIRARSHNAAVQTRS